SEGIEVTDGANTEVNVILLFEETGAISGSVVDFDSGEPIESVTVIVTLSGGVYTFNSSADTNESGEFVIEQLPVGVYDLTVLTTDYDEYIAGGIGVTEGAINDIGEIKLMPSTSSP
ncbi:MAG: carboxypeptidase-like regulatory domain-containing protein, partial [Actinomycetota bacterium]|nr:carboxypeptidase-like regulatory domain-containing protein [Actinomycetota bacterium]